MTVVTVLRRGFFAALAGIVAAGSAAVAEEAARVGDVIVERAWTRATPPTATVAAGYMTIRNVGETADRLIGAEAGFAGRTELHTMAMDGGVMRMREVEEGFEIPAGGEIVLAPGGDHVMFMALSGPLGQGERRETTLVFEKAGALDVVLPVAAPGATNPDAP